jgi:hypothetical protein
METRRGVCWPNDRAGITMASDWDVERRGPHAPARVCQDVAVAEARPVCSATLKPANTACQVVRARSDTMSDGHGEVV